jgi:hypothetical protein
MKKIVLRGLSPDVERLIKERAKETKRTRREAVVEILSDAATERAIQHDVALLEEWFPDEMIDGESAF